MNHKSTPGSEPIYDAQTLGLPKMLVLGLQHLFAMFGAAVLVPVLAQGYGLPLSIQTTPFFVSTDTLFFHTRTHLKVSTFLGSPFAYLGSFSVMTALNSDAYATVEPSVGLQCTCGGTIVTGLPCVILATVIKLVDVKRAMRFPFPVVTGSIVILIGLSPTPSMVSSTSSYWWLTLLSVAVIVVANIWRKGIVKIIPTLLGVMISYLVAAAANALGATAVDASGSAIPLMDFPAVAVAASIGLQPLFTDFIGLIARFDMTSVLVIIPITMAAMTEHIDDVFAISATVGENFLECPGLHHTLIGDGIATSLAGLFGGPASTTYDENTGVLVLSRVYDPKVVRLAAMYAVVLSSSPAFTVLVSSISTAVIGGVSFILYDMIPAIGMRNVMENRVDLINSHNLIIAAVVLICGLGFSGGITFPVGGTHATLTNLIIAAVAGIALNTILPGKDYEFGPDATEGRSGDFGRY